MASVVETTTATSSAAAADLSLSNFVQQHLSIHDNDQSGAKDEEKSSHEGGCGICAICLDKIAIEEIALVKGCEHAYCVTCILRWASYKEKATCPQCKHQFDSLSVHRSLDGSMNDYMFEESVCLLLRASWFKPLSVVDYHEDMYDPEDYFTYVDEDEGDDDVFDEDYFRGSTLRIGNRRWGDSGYVRAGRQEARPVYRPNTQDQGASSSSEPKKASTKDTTGRRAKRALKREAADRAAAEKHQKHLARLGRT